MLPEAALKNQLSEIALKRCQCRLWREVRTEYLLGPHPNPLYAEGPVIRGARFTPKGGFPTLYLSYDRQTASLEIQATFRRADGSLIDLADSPTTMLPVDADLDAVLDLTDPDVLEQLQTNTSELTGEWRYTQLKSEAVTQTLGRVAFGSQHIKAIKYISAKDPYHGRCLAVFVDRLQRYYDRLICVDKSGKLSVHLP